MKVTFVTAAPPGQAPPSQPSMQLYRDPVTGHRIGPMDHWKAQLKAEGVAVCVHEGCRMAFLSLAGVVSHFRQCMGASRAYDGVPCTVCSFQFRHFTAMQTHRQRSHAIGQPAPLEGPRIPAPPPAQKTEPQHGMMSSSPSSSFHAYNQISLPDSTVERSTGSSPLELDAEAERRRMADRIMAESRLISTPRPVGRPPKAVARTRRMPIVESLHHLNTFDLPVDGEEDSDAAASTSYHQPAQRDASPPQVSSSCSSSSQARLNPTTPSPHHHHHRTDSPSSAGSHASVHRHVKPEQNLRETSSTSSAAFAELQARQAAIAEEERRLDALERAVLDSEKRAQMRLLAEREQALLLRKQALLHRASEAARILDEDPEVSVASAAANDVGEDRVRFVDSRLVTLDDTIDVSSVDSNQEAEEFIGPSPTPEQDMCASDLAFESPSKAFGAGHEDRSRSAGAAVPVEAAAEPPEAPTAESSAQEASRLTSEEEHISPEDAEVEKPADSISAETEEDVHPGHIPLESQEAVAQEVVPSEQILPGEDNQGGAASMEHEEENLADVSAASFPADDIAFSPPSAFSDSIAEVVVPCQETKDRADDEHYARSPSPLPTFEEDVPGRDEAVPMAVEEPRIPSWGESQGGEDPPETAEEHEILAEGDLPIVVVEQEDIAYVEEQEVPKAAAVISPPVRINSFDDVPPMEERPARRRNRLTTLEVLAAVAEETPARRSKRASAARKVKLDAEDDHEEMTQATENSRREGSPGVRPPPASTPTRTAAAKVKAKAAREGGEQGHYCDVCDRRNFSSPRDFYSHMALEHQGAGLAAEDVETTLLKCFKFVKSIACHKCNNKRFTTLIGMRYHWNSCGKTAEEIEASKERCSDCAYRGFTQNMRQHVTRHQAERKSALKEELRAQLPLHGDGDEVDGGGSASAKKRPRMAAKRASAKLSEAIAVLKQKNNDMSGDEDSEDDATFKAPAAGDSGDDDDDDDEPTDSEPSVSGDESDLSGGEEMGSHGPPKKRKRLSTPGHNSSGGGHRFASGSKSLLKPCPEFFKLEERFRRDNYDTEAFDDLPASLKSWHCAMDDADLASYSPTLTRSPRFLAGPMLDAQSGNGAAGASSLERFTGQAFDEAASFFAGGPIWALDWHPESADAHSTHFAVSTHREPHDTSPICRADRSRGLIQIWRLNRPSGDDLSGAALKLELGIGHAFGKVWTLRWAPSGNRNGDRLGLLAAACSDGSIRVFSVLDPDRVAESKFRLVEPALTLRLSPSGASSPCLSMAWHRGRGHGVIAGGFADGSYALWRVTASADCPLLEPATGTLYPYCVTTHAHMSCITSLDLSPHHTDDDGYPQFLVTGSSDRTVCVWNLNRPQSPVQSVKRGWVTHVAWLPHHAASVLVTFDSVFLQSATQTLMFDLAAGKNKTFPVMAQNSAVLGLSYDPWLNTATAVTSGGEVVAVVGPSLNKQLDNDKDSTRRRIYLSRVGYTPGSSSDSQELALAQPPTESTADEKRALLFEDLPSQCDVKALPESFLRRTRYCETMQTEDLTTAHPAQSLHRVSMNADPRWRGFVLYGGQSGLGRIVTLKPLLK